jgi:hypothetical protein
VAISSSITREGMAASSSQVAKELTHGLALLISSFLHLLGGPMDLVAAVVRGLRALELVPEEVLPTMAGGLTAAGLGHSPLGWRRAVGESTPAAEHSEGPAWAYTAWLLAVVVDFAAEEKGATAKLTDSLVAKLLEEDAR